MSRIMISIDDGLHQSMRELAIRRKHNVGVEYTRALTMYLARVDNYLGAKPKTPNQTKPITKGTNDHGDKETSNKETGNTRNR